MNIIGKLLKRAFQSIIYTYSVYYHWKAAEKSFPMILTSLKSNKK